MSLLRLSQFFVTCAAALSLGACTTAPTGPANPPMRADAGPIQDYTRDGTYDRYAGSHGFMIVVFGGRLVAVSAICPHDRNTLHKSDAGFTCPGDGSTFAPTGDVRTGPAKDPLLRYVVWLDSNRHVIVDTTKPLIQPLWGRTDAYLIVPR